MLLTEQELSVLQQRYDAAIASSDGMGYPVELIEVRDGRLVAHARLERHVRPGGTLAGPVPLVLVDALAWLLLTAHLPDGSDAYTTDMSVQFLRPVPVGDVEATLTLDRMGRRRAAVSAVVCSAGSPRPLTHLLLGFSLRRGADSSTPEPLHADGR